MKIDYGSELVKVERVGRNPRVVVCVVVAGPEVGREVGVRVRDSRRWVGLEGKEIVVERSGVEPWVYRGREPVINVRSRRAAMLRWR